MKITNNRRRTLLIALASILLLSSCAVQPPAPVVTRSAEVRVITSGAFTEAYKMLVPLFEKDSGHNVISHYGVHGQRVGFDPEPPCAQRACGCVDHGWPRAG